MRIITGILFLVFAACFFAVAIFWQPEQVDATAEAPVEHIVYRDRVMPCPACAVRQEAVSLPPVPVDDASDADAEVDPVTLMADALSDPSTDDPVTGLTLLQRAYMRAVRDRLPQAQSVAELTDHARGLAHSKKIISAMDAVVGENRRRVIADTLWAELEMFGFDHLAFSQAHPDRQMLCGFLNYRRYEEEQDR